MEQAFEALSLRFVARSLPGPMRGVEVQADEEGLTRLGIGVDDIDCAASKKIGQITGGRTFVSSSHRSSVSLAGGPNLCVK